MGPPFLPFNGYVSTRKDLNLEQSLFHKFIELINFDQSLQATHKKKDEAESQATFIEAELAKVTTQQAGAQKKVHDLKKEVDAKELEMKVLDIQLQTAQERLSVAHNQTEYQALKNEIAKVKQKQHDFESTLLAVWNDFEIAQKELVSLEKSIQEKQQELQDSLAIKQAIIKEQEAILAAADKQREAKLVAVPEEWLEKYNRMKHAVTNPVVKAEKGSCTACFYQLPRQDMLDLQDNNLIQCKDCYRLLYLEFVEQVQESPA